MHRITPAERRRIYDEQIAPLVALVADPAQPLPLVGVDWADGSPPTLWGQTVTNGRLEAAGVRYGPLGRGAAGARLCIHTSLESGVVSPPDPAGLARSTFGVEVADVTSWHEGAVLVLFDQPVDITMSADGTYWYAQGQISVEGVAVVVTAAVADLNPATVHARRLSGADLVAASVWPSALRDWPDST